MESNSKPKQEQEVVVDFGEDFGKMTKKSISELFVEIHANISPVDPLNKQAPMDPPLEP